MKAIITLAILLACGSVFYYYSVFLPQQNIRGQQDINAIRNVIAPTPAQQKVQQQKAIQEQANFEKALDDYSDCQLKMIDKSSEYVQQQCASENPQGDWMNILDPNSNYNKCKTRVENSAEYESKFTCPRNF